MAATWVASIKNVASVIFVYVYALVEFKFIQLLTKLLPTDPTSN